VAAPVRPLRVRVGRHNDCQPIFVDVARSGDLLAGISGLAIRRVTPLSTSGAVLRRLLGSYRGRHSLAFRPSRFSRACRLRGGRFAVSILATALPGRRRHAGNH
jgi:hypothetical protein